MWFEQHLYLVLLVRLADIEWNSGEDVCDADVRIQAAVESCIDFHKYTRNVRRKYVIVRFLDVRMKVLPRLGLVHWFVARVT